MAIGDPTSAERKQPHEVADAIRDAVVRGVYAPGYRLVEAELSDAYQASRSAVRAALRLLVSDGLVEVERHKGARVRQVSLDEAIEITEVRVVVESMVAAKAAERVAPDDAAALKSIGARMRRAVEASDTVEYSDLNRRLHTMIRRTARQSIAEGILERLHGQLVRHGFRLALKPGRPAVSLAQHERIIAALVAKHPAEAAEAMRDHLTDVIAALHELDAHDGQGSTSLV